MTVNSVEQILLRKQSGKVTLSGPMFMLVARSLFAILCQVLVYASIFSGNREGWIASGEWWRVYGTFIDIGCIALLIWYTQNEGIKLFDLGDYHREGWGRDVLLGLGLSIPLLLAFAVPTLVLEIVFYGEQAPVPGAGLPLWGKIYALVIWPIIWAFAEDNVYFGYALPRFEAFTGRKWLAVFIVSTFAAVQHIFLPFRLEWQWIISHFLGYIVGSIAICLLYQRLRRLLPLHIAHWGINVVGMIMVLVSVLRP